MQLQWKFKVANYFPFALDYDRQMQSSTNFTVSRMSESSVNISLHSGWQLLLVEVWALYFPPRGQGQK